MALNPIEYSFWPTPETPEHGLLHCLDDDGNRVTLLGDPELVKMMRDASPGALTGAEIGGVWERREGWPGVDWFDL